MVMFFSGISNLFYVAKKFHFSLDLFPILQEIILIIVGLRIYMVFCVEVLLSLFF
jgi:hypothetical protein